MSENKKTISIDKDLFSINKKKGAKNKTEKRQKKESPVVKPNKLRRDLLSKIKKHQQMEQIKNKQKENSEDIKEKNDFNESLSYLESLSKKHKEKKNQTRKNKNKLSGGDNKKTKEDQFVNVDLPENIFDSIKPDNTPSHFMSQPLHTPTYTTPPSIPYDNNLPLELKVNNNPSENTDINTGGAIVENNVYFHKNIEQKPEEHIKTNNSVVNIPSDNTIPYGCLKGGDKPTYRIWNNTTQKNYSTNKPKKHKKIKQKKKTTRKTKYKLGRSKKNISVLIKNNKTRRNVQIEMGKLKQKPISEVKKFLYEKNLLKIGSNAPNDVLRTMYEQAILSGDITNIGNGVLLHNFINEKN